MFLTYKIKSARIVFLTLTLCLFVSISNVYSQSNQIQRVRISFTSPDNSVRQLLLGFTPNNAATDGFDWGYDAPNPDNFPNDLNWIIEDGRYVIQGVGAFDNSKFYELGMFLSDSGTIAINLTALENFNEPINVFIYDALLNAYTSINESSFSTEMEAGQYLKRFYLTFNNAMPANITPNALSNAEFIAEDASINYIKYSNSLQINFNQDNVIHEVDIYNLRGQQLVSKSFKNEKSTQISLNGIEGNNLLIVRVKSKQKFISRKIMIH